MLRGINVLVSHVGHSFSRASSSKAGKILDYIIDSSSMFGKPCMLAISLIAHALDEQVALGSLPLSLICSLTAWCLG